ncbi:MAG: FadR family transcriptional regulator [Lentisphaeria bacterium]|nr:FadR family transcriptional regulator [Lentisphaeria bacterium]
MTALDTVRQRLRTARPPSAVDRVILRIRELLLSRALGRGDRLPSEGELAELLGVSRGSIREAMKILSSFGVVTIRAGDGTRIAADPGPMLVDPMLFQLLLSNPGREALTELRHLLESGMVPLLARHAAAADLDALRAALGRTERLVAEGCTDADALTEADLEFHRALGRASHNPLVERIYGFAMDFLRSSIRDTYVRARTGERGVRYHGAILGALEAADEVGLRQAIEASIAAWDEFR